MEGKICHIGDSKIFGERCIVADRTKIKAKLTNHGKICYWMGYVDNHALNTYRILNPKTGRVILSRDVSFLRQAKTQIVSELEYEREEEEEGQTGLTRDRMAVVFSLSTHTPLNLDGHLLSSTLDPPTISSRSRSWTQWMTWRTR